MKMITAIVHKEDARDASRALVRAHFSVTQMPTVGGFLQAGNISLMMGVADDRVDECLDVLRRCCSSHQEVVPDVSGFSPDGPEVAPSVVTVGGAVVFVTNVERFEKL